MLGDSKSAIAVLRKFGEYLRQEKKIAVLLFVAMLLEC